MSAWIKTRAGEYVNAGHLRRMFIRGDDDSETTEDGPEWIGIVAEDGDGTRYKLARWKTARCIATDVLQAIAEQSQDGRHPVVTVSAIIAHTDGCVNCPHTSAHHPGGGPCLYNLEPGPTEDCYCRGLVL